LLLRAQFKTFFLDAIAPLQNRSRSLNIVALKMHFFNEKKSIFALYSQVVSGGPGQLQSRRRLRHRKVSPPAKTMEKVKTGQKSVYVGAVVLVRARENASAS
jgi:hypothetical protein